MGNITRCTQCRDYMYHFAADRYEGGVFLKSGTPYCRFDPKKYKKLKKRESDRGIPPGCPRKLAQNRLEIHRRTGEYIPMPFDSPYMAIYRPVYGFDADVYDLDGLRDYLDWRSGALENGSALHAGDVVSLYNGLSRLSWLYKGCGEFEPVVLVGNSIVKEK